MKTLVRNAYILIEEINEVKKTSGGLMLSEGDTKEISMGKGKVLDVGPLVTDGVLVGDIAIFDKRMAHSVDVDGEIFKVLGENQVILIQRG